jgi:Methyltransferase FkbM domain
VRRGGDFVGRQVPVHTLDSYQLDDVALLKIDVEGMEADVIRGGLDTIRRNRPVIFAEAWDAGYEQATAELLEPLGYRMVRRYRWNQRRWDPGAP